jgi:hypothetical protein
MREKAEVPKASVAANVPKSIVTKVAGTAAAAKAAATTPPYKTLPKKESKLPDNWWLWLVLLISIPLLIFSFYKLMSDDNASEPIEHIDSDRVNTSPANDEDALDDPEDVADFEMDEEDGINYREDMDNESISDEMTADEEMMEEEEDLDTESPAIPPSAKKAFIVVHSFGSKRNAEKFSKKLINAGYNAGSERDGGFYRVGVNIVYESKSELNSLVKELGKKYKSNPKVWDGGIGKKN